MDTQRIAIHAMTVALPASGGAAPEKIQVLPLGKFRGRDGRGPYIVDDPQAIIQATRDYFRNNDIPVDYDHQTEYAARNGRPAPAAGWMRNLRVEGDGIWADVEWTDRGGRAVASREFRYISPVFYHGADGRISRIRAAALVNIPNLDMKALSAAQAEKEPPMDFKETMAQTLGLSLAAGEGEIIAAAASLRDDLSRAKTSLAAGPDPARYVPKDMHDAIATELASLKADVARARSGELVKSAQSAGKLTPAMEQWGLSYATADPEGFKAWMAAAPVLAPASKDALAQAAPPRDSGTHAALSPEEKAVCAACGISEDKYRQAGREVPHGQTH